MIDVEDSNLLALKSADYSGFVRTGLEYNLDTLKQERLKIYNHLQNNGYFYIHESDVIIQADTSAGYKQVDIRIRINKDMSAIEQSTTSISEYKIIISKFWTIFCDIKQSSWFYRFNLETNNIFLYYFTKKNCSWKIIIFS